MEGMIPTDCGLVGKSGDNPTTIAYVGVGSAKGQREEKGFSFSQAWIPNSRAKARISDVLNLILM
jgi:hypothetical protein